MLIFEKAYIPVVQYDSIGHVVACGFYGMCVLPHPKFQQESHYAASSCKQNSQCIVLCLQPSIVIFKPHPLTVI